MDIHPKPKTLTKPYTLCRPTRVSFSGRWPLVVAADEKGNVYFLSLVSPLHIMNPEPGTRISNPEARISKPEARNILCRRPLVGLAPNFPHHILNLKPLTLNPKPEARVPKPEALCTGFTLAVDGGGRRGDCGSPPPPYPRPSSSSD